MAKVSQSERRLRVALVFGGAIQAEETLDKPKNVTLGYTDLDVLPLPDGVTSLDQLTLLRWTGTSYNVLLEPSMSGAIWVGGQRREVAALRAMGQTIELGPDDYGVLTLGNAAVFFQMVRRAPRIGMGIPTFLAEPARLLALGLSLFLHAALLALLFLALAESPHTDDLELPTDLIRRFMVTPPPKTSSSPRTRAAPTPRTRACATATRRAARRPRKRRAASAARTRSRKRPRWRARSPAAARPSGSRTSASSAPSAAARARATRSPRPSRARASPTSSAASALRRR